VLQPFGPALLDIVRATSPGSHCETHLLPFGKQGRCADVRVSSFGADLILVTVVDATEREAQRLVHQRTEEELKALVALTSAAVRVADVSGRLLSGNDSARAEHEERLPTTVRELWEADAPHDVTNNRPLSFLDAPAMRALAGTTVKRQLLEVRRRGDRRVIEASAAPLRDAQQNVWGVILLDQDVTNRSLLEQQLHDQVGHQQPTHDTGELERLVEERSRALIESHEQQVRERRLTAVGQLAAGVMHDVNNALHPIMAAAYLLRVYAERPDQVRDYADRIQKAAEIAAATASRVGRFIRQEPVHAGGDVEIDLSELAEEVLDLTEPMRLQRSSSSREVRIVRMFADGAHTRGLPGEIREALLNLVQNAIDALPEGGTLTVRTSIEGSDACIAVRDTGVGMTPEVRERAFEPFFTTKGKRGGSGLGLAEVYGIARRHRGTVTISSVPGRGTEVMLRFPLNRGAAAMPTTVEEEPVVKPTRILVVEDHDDGREFLRRILQGDGHDVTAVGSCTEAHEQLAGNEPFDLMLTDVGLPDGNGWELVQQAKASHPTLRIGVITGWEANTGSPEASGAEFVLRKPLRAPDLKAHIAGRSKPA
jgi:signal transduction histidine kinase